MKVSYACGNPNKHYPRADKADGLLHLTIACSFLYNLENRGLVPSVSFKAHTHLPNESGNHAGHLCS